MSQIEFYRQSASECLALAKRADDPECRALLIALASRLLDLSRPKHGIGGPERPWKNRSRQEVRPEGHQMKGDGGGVTLMHTGPSLGPL